MAACSIMRIDSSNAEGSNMCKTSHERIVSVTTASTSAAPTSDYLGPNCDGRTMDLVHALHRTDLFTPS
eukprot:4877945-Pyramimonas_sp.AAC.1